MLTLVVKVVQCRHSPLFYSHIPKNVTKENPFAFLLTPKWNWKWRRASKVQKWKQGRALVLDATEAEESRGTLLDTETTTLRRKVLDEGAVTQVVDLAQGIGMIS